ncbi:MAG: Gfo/Idh/MocA family oxidoreductase [Sporichthyaceae bacterium]|nr:Gfo/Idh/MocA family oxidoreductase [Sporichthyaceae bacterium]
MTELRVGLVGYGMAGRDIHAQLLRAAPGMRLTHVVTGDAVRAAQAEEDNPGVRVLAAPADLWSAAGSVDLAVIASPGHVHVEQARAAVEHGLPVVVDKPLGLDAESARTVVDSARRLGVPMTVFQNRRWDSEHLTAREVLSSGVLGDVVRYEARFERWRPVPKDRWRENTPTDAGGGLLMDLHSHLVDGAIDLFGPVASVYAELAAVSTVGDDVAFLALRHQSGVTSHLSATSLAGAPGPRTRLLGRDGAYLVAAITGEATAYQEWADADDDHRGWVVRGEQSEPVRRAPGGWGDFYTAVADMVRGSAPPPVEPTEAVTVLTVLDAARRSARERMTVELG